MRFDVPKEVVSYNGSHLQNHIVKELAI
jgi:hypothetical protein